MKQLIASLVALGMVAVGGGKAQAYRIEHSQYDAWLAAAIGGDDFLPGAVRECVAPGGPVFLTLTPGSGVDSLTSAVPELVLNPLATYPALETVLAGIAGQLPDETSTYSMDSALLPFPILYRKEP